MTIKAVLYDHDGTLVDSETTHYQIWAEVIKPLGADLPIEVYKQFHAGMPTPANAKDIIERYGLPHSATALAELKDAATQVFLNRDRFPLMPGVKQSLQLFTELGMQLAVVTGAGRQGVTSSIGKHGIEQVFTQIISADDVKKSKPAPDCYLLAAERLQLAPEQCIAIEDTEHGAEAAHAAGIQCVVVPNSMSDEHDFPKAIKVCDDILQASHWIQRELLNHS